MSYKGFDPDFKCLGKQYEEGQVYEEQGGTICGEGMMHYCDEPFDVWDYYGPVAEDGRLNTFAEVEPLGEVATAGNKRGTTKLKIGAKLSLSGFVKIAVDFLLEKTKGGSEENDNGEKNAQIGSSGDWAQIGSSGYGAKIGSSGDWAQIGSSGDWAQIGSSGYGAQIGSSGDWAQIGSSGYGAKIGSSGAWAQIGSSGDGAKIGSSGDGAQIGSSGYGAQIGSSGDWAKIVSEGEKSVICCAGHGCTVSAKAGSWITLAEWKENEATGKWEPLTVKTFYVDGETIKADTPYKLEGGELKEVTA